MTPEMESGFLHLRAKNHVLSISGSCPLWDNVKQVSFSITTLLLIGYRAHALTSPPDVFCSQVEHFPSF